MNPDENTIAEHKLEVGHGHTLYIQDWGNKKAKKPIIFLHGGPGSSTKDKYRLNFDPKNQRVIFFDQRGCGKSTPLGRWHHNNTQELAADITKIADFLKIDTFILTGESWGSCLALYYALCEPRRVSALVVGGVFTGSQAEIDWLDQGVFQSHFPDAWAKYLAATPPTYQDNPSAYHRANVLGSNESLAISSAHAYSELEGSVVSLNDQHTPEPITDFDPTSTRLEMRYLAKRCFLPDGFILQNAQKLKMPLYIVQGRYDFVCPPKTAYQLSQKAPNAHLTWTVSGHRNEHENVSVKRGIYSYLSTGN